MDNKYININMSNQIFRNITFLKMIFFLFLILSFSKNTNGQCIIPGGDTTICYGEEITYCVNTSSLPAHDSIRIEYDLFPANTWDGNGDFGGGTDFWYCIFNQDTIFTTTFSNTGGFGNTQSFPDEFVDGSVPPYQQCSGIWPPLPVNSNPGYTGALIPGTPNTISSKYRLTHTIAHNSSSAIIDFISGLNEAPNNESWSMDNVEISLWNNSTSWQTFFQENFNLPLSLGSEWNAATGPNCSYPLLPTTFSSHTTFTGQDGIGPFDGNTRVSLNLNLINNNSIPSTSVLWSTGDTTLCISVTPTNTTTYSVMVFDSTVVTCYDSVTVTIEPPLNVLAVVNNVSSQAACNGQIFLSVSGGQPLYNYQWDTSGVSIPGAAVLQNLCENIYCVSITDASGSGCSTDTCFNIEWNPCELTDSIITPILCNGGSGTIQVTLDTLLGTGPIPYNPLPRFIVDIYSVNPYVLVTTIQTNAITTFITPLFANDYIISIYDRSWGDSCYTNVTLTEPEPIVIYTTVDSTSAPWIQDGVITIDSITGGNLGYNITWLDSVLIPLPTFGNLTQDSLGYSNQWNGGYTINVTDTNGCFGDTIVYVHPKNAGDSLVIDTLSVIHPTCFESCDGKLWAHILGVGTFAVPPFTFKWYNLLTGALLKTDSCIYDSLSLSWACSPWYSPSHVGTYTNRCAGVYGLSVYDYYGNSFADQEFIVIDPLPVEIELGPDIVLPCGEDTVLSVSPSGGNIINDTILIRTESLSFGSLISFTDTLSAGKEYLLVVSGTYQDALGNVYDAAYNTATQTPVMDWILGVAQTQRPTPDIYQPSNTYNFGFSGFNGVQQVVLPAGNTFFGTLTFQLYEISLDTTIYTYAWTSNPPGGPNPPIISAADTVLAYPGVNGTDYFVTVSDQNGCETKDTINVSWDLLILQIDTVSASYVGCNGQSTGYVAVSVNENFGFAPYTYIINGNATNDTTFNLPAGVYSVSITDVVGCLSDTTTIEILENDSLYSCIDPINFVSVMVENFSLSFDTATSYTTVQTQLGLQYELIVSGTYTDTITNLNIPYLDAAYRFMPTVVAHATNPWSWNGTFNARPDPDTYSNTHTYSYSFTGTGNAQVFSYTDIAGDYFGSTGQLDFELYKSVCPDLDTAYTCYGESTGFATIYPNGGVPFTDALGNPYYIYEWKDNLGNIVNANATATGLPAGSYTVTVIDAVSCTYDRALLVMEPDFPLEIDTNSNSTNVVCYGESESSITVYNSGGFQPYLCVLIYDSGSSQDTVEVYSGFGLDSIVFDSLTFGTYYYYLYDSVPDNLYGDYMPCPKMMQFDITEPLELLSATSLIDNVACWGDSTGQASVAVIGGVGPYIYQWGNTPFGPDSLGETTSHAYNLSADTSLGFPGAILHFVTITDANGCQIEDSVEIRQMYEKIQPFYIDNGNSVYAINIIEDSVTCYEDCDGVAALSTIGGVLPHEYTWDVLEPGNSGLNHTSLNQPDTVDYLCAGGHDILIVDNIGCGAVVRFRIYQPDQIYAIGTLTTPISCFGYNDGSAQVYGIGGNDLPPSIYSYSWQLDPTIYSSLDDSLFWAADTNNLGQSLNNQSAQYTDSILPPGVHIVTVTDYKGCSASDTVQFIEPALLTLEFTDTVYAYCEFTESASLCVQAYGGTVNYTYQFNDNYHQNNTGSGTGSNNPFCANNLTPVNTNTAPGIPIDDYYVTVIDERGCFADNYINIDSVTNSFYIQSIDITDTTYILNDIDTIEIQHVSCFNGTNGSINITNITGGMGSFPAGYSFAWTGPNSYSSTLSNISTLEAGSYAVTISDSAVGLAGPPCDITINIEITEPEQLLVSIYDTTGATCIGDGYLISPQTPTIQGSADGQIMVSITGGTGPYSYDFDEQGIYPLVNTVPIPTPGDTLIDNLYSGNHTIYITDANNCEGYVNPAGIATATIDIGIYVTASVTAIQDALCSNSNNGSAMVDMPNSIFNYTWETNPIGTNPVDTGISCNLFYGSVIGEDYMLVAHYSDAANFDQNYIGCDATALFTIYSPSAIEYTFPLPYPIEPSCWGYSDGEIKINIFGGTLPYQWEWDVTLSTPTGPTGSGSTPYILGLQYDTYTITIFDAEGCQETFDIPLGQPDQIQNNFTIIDASCNGDNDGVITAIVSGGTFTPNAVNNDFNWTPGTPVAFGGPASLTWNAGDGIYPVTITDENGCFINDIAIVGEPNELSVTLSSNINYGDFHVSCDGASDGEILATLSGGISPFTYAWSNAQITNPAYSVPAGLLSVVVTDGNGCIADESITLLEPNPIDLSDFNLHPNGYGYNVDCFGGSDGQISLFPTGGIPDNNGEYTYTWTPSVNHPINNDGSIGINLTEGPYTVVVEALYGCTSTFSETLISPNETFNATVNTVNYAGPGNSPYSIDFQDLTTYSTGIPIPIINLNHEWCWDYVIEWDAELQTYDTACTLGNTELSPNTAQTFNHVFNNIGVNDVFVIVTHNETGCTHKIDFTIEVQGMPEINNVFSPNSDGINDIFSIGEFGMDNMAVAIFNRWGEQVYSWEGDGGEWDGKGVDGQALSEGVYFYVLKATGEDGYYYEKKGSITLIR